MLPSPEKFDPIYAALTGALLAMIGSWITAWITGKQATTRQKNDLEHSCRERENERKHAASQKELERLYALRREVYLPFIDAMSNAVSFVPTIPTCPIEAIQTLSQLAELARHFSRVSVIAPPPVIEPVMRVVLYLQTVTTTLINRRWPIEEVASELCLNRNSVQWMLDRQKNLGQRMDAFVDTGEFKPQFKILFDQHTELGQEVKRVLEIQESLNKKKAGLELALLQQASRLLMPIREHTIPVMVSIRNEVGLPIDEDWYRRFSEESAQTAMKLIARAFSI